ncbi:MAG: uroporphyrinogen-III C-methyltransferase [Pseudomonadota bacterium]
MAPGKVYLIGAGPGDPGLITVRGLELLSCADAVLYDALAHPALLDACPNAEKRNVGKRYGQDSAVQVAINAELVALARAGKRVVRLKGGDPLLFARGAEELQALREAGIAFEIVPGVSSPLAASAYSGIPLTHRELSSSVTFITGSDREGKDWSPASWQKLGHRNRHDLHLHGHAPDRTDHGGDHRWRAQRRDRSKPWCNGRPARSSAWSAAP